jgi:PAS domain S-box-containing protein
MRVDGKLLRGALVAILASAIAFGLQLAIPTLPRFLALFPAVLIAGFVGGPWLGGATLLATSAFAIYDAADADLPITDTAFLVALLCFLLSGVLAVALMTLRSSAATRLERERQRLQAALRAARAAVWEISPDGRLYWDENFYRLVGLSPKDVPPSTSEFLSMVDERDRPRMEEARRLMNAGRDPPQMDAYRLVRGDGDLVWLENHRTRVTDDGDFFIGITQDVTRRKLAEERVEALLRESEHRAKNQFSVIMAIARETSRATDSLESFEAAFEARLLGLSRSHELLVKGDWRGTTLHALVTAHLEPFASEDRYELAGPEIVLTPSSAQYLGMALHELATNAAKYGALATAAGRLSLKWSLSEGGYGQTFRMEWREKNSPAKSFTLGSAGFGTRMLMHIVPGSIGGVATREVLTDGIVWTISGPLARIAEVPSA